MPSRLLWLSFALVAALTATPRTHAKPPDLPHPVHPDLVPAPPDERPAPVEIDIVLPLFGGPYGATTWSVEKVPVAPKPEKKGKLSKTSALRHWKRAKQLLVLADLCLEMGWYDEAGLCCGMVCELCPNTRFEREAVVRLEAICSACPAEDGEEAETKTDEVVEPEMPANVHGCFDVTDLMGEPTGEIVRTSSAEVALGEQLIEHLRKTIRPASWKSAGGVGTIEYNPATNSLVVVHDEETQNEVAAYLDRLRARKDRHNRPAGWTGGEEASSADRAPRRLPLLVAMGHGIGDLFEGRDADEVVRELVRIIETSFAPGSWVNRGGVGRLEYNPALRCFFILQTPDVQEAVRDLLERVRQEMRQKKQAGEKVNGLLDEAHRALSAGETTEAQQLVRRALAVDRAAVLAHPFVYKMQLLAQALSEPEPLRPRMPKVDPGIVRAYGEILEAAPKHDEAVKPAVHRESAEGVGLPICIDRDGGRLRVQVQLGSWTLKLLDEGKGKSSFTIGVSLP